MAFLSFAMYGVHELTVLKQKKKYNVNQNDKIYILIIIVINRKSYNNNIIE